MQAIVGSLLYYARAIDNKSLVGLSAIDNQQAAATASTADAIDQLLSYCATYHNYGIVFCTSDMVLAAYSDTGFNNESKSRSQVGAHIFLSKNDQVPR